MMHKDDGAYQKSMRHATAFLHQDEDNDEDRVEEAVDTDHNRNIAHNIRHVCGFIQHDRNSEARMAKF